jgi:hypothetical protein
MRCFMRTSIYNAHSAGLTTMFIGKSHLPSARQIEYNIAGFRILQKNTFQAVLNHYQSRPQLSNSV